MVLDKQAFRTVILAVGVVFLLGGLSAVPAWAQTAQDGGSGGVPVEAEDNNSNGKLDAGDSFTIPGQYEVLSNASLTVEDGDGAVQTLIDGKNVEMSATASGLEVEVTESREQSLDAQETGEEEELDAAGIRVTDINGVVITITSDGQYGDQYVDISVEQDAVITNTIPNTKLPNTGGVSMLGVFFLFVAGGGLLTAVVRRRY